MDAEILVAGLDAALAGGGSLADAVSEIDQAVFDEAEFPASLFGELLRRLASPLLLDHRDAVNFVKLFEEQAGLLRDAQREQLLQALPPFLASVRDDIAAFLAAEVWVDVGGGGRAVLDGLSRLTSSLPARRLAVLVHGFDWLCKHAQDERVRAESLAQLQRLQRHRDPAVAAEAAAAVARRTGPSDHNGRRR